MMDPLHLTQTLLSTQVPLLPQADLLRGYRVLGWGVVLAGSALWWLRRGDGRRAWQRGLPLLMLLWCLLPGPWSPDYWLGLAFRAPSMLTVLLCVWALLRHYRPRQVAAFPLEGLRCWAPALVLLGWLLLLDAFAVWPWSLYSWGFAPLTLGVMVLLAMLPWLLRGATGVAIVLVGTLVVFVALHLPTGNVWDALLDPWSWLLLQADWLQRRLRRGQIQR